jgi:RHS repeat-associated protein
LSTKKRAYDFDYNFQYQLKAASYKMSINNGTLWNTDFDFFNESNITYDFNGNIKTLNRKQKTNAMSAPVIDQLTYDYGSGGNKLFGVTDSAPAGEDKAKGFNDVNTTGDDYVYDINGNLIQDKNKNFTVTYNFLNLSDRITFSDNSYIQYTYDAGGTKLRQAYYNASNQLVSKTDYVGELMLLNDQLQMIHHEEGRIIPADYTNLIPNPTREGGSLEGYTVTSSGSAPTPSVETIGSQTYVKVVNNQTGSSTPDVFRIGSTFTVKPGESYQFTVLGYQSVGETANLYVWDNNGNILWQSVALPIGSTNEGIVTASFTVPTGNTQINLGVIWNSPSNGDTFYINRVALYKTDFEYQYFLTDQVGSPRVVLQTSPVTTTHAATMESENFNTENPKWLNLNSSRFTMPPSVPLANATPGGDQSIMMDKDYRVGPAKSFKVFPGDQINGNVQAYFTTGGFSQAATTSVVVAAVQAVLSGGSSLIDGAIQSAYTTTGNSAIALGGYKGAAQPSAYLNYILFDEFYVPLKAKSFPVQNTAGVPHTVAFDQILLIDQLGYLFVYLSYYNENTLPVYFDELKITYTESPVIQVNNYYPFGYTATEWVREGETDNNFLFQGKELEDRTGLNDFHARLYDPSTGRWLGNDPKADKMPYISNYASMMNNPVFYIDPDGECPICPVLLAGALLGAFTSAGVYVVTHNDGQFDLGDFLESTGKGALIGAISAGAATLLGQVGQKIAVALEDNVGSGLINLLYEGAATTAQSVVSNLAVGNDPFSRLDIGVGPFVLPFRDGVISDNIFDHYNNITSAAGYGLGLIDYARGFVKPVFNKRTLSYDFMSKAITIERGVKYSKYRPGDPKYEPPSAAKRVSGRFPGKGSYQNNVGFWNRKLAPKDFYGPSGVQALGTIIYKADPSSRTRLHETLHLIQSRILPNSSIAGLSRFIHVNILKLPFDYRTNIWEKGVYKLTGE